MRSVPEDIIIHSHRHENLESHTINMVVSFVGHYAIKSVGNGGKVPHNIRRGSRGKLMTSFIPSPPLLYFGEKQTRGNYWAGDLTRPEMEGKKIPAPGIRTEYFKHAT
jgi:hypothetical protein